MEVTEQNVILCQRWLQITAALKDNQKYCPLLPTSEFEGTTTIENCTLLQILLLELKNW